MQVLRSTLAGLGMDAARVRLVSSRKSPILWEESKLPARSVIFVSIYSRAAADNRKTSALTAYSTVQRARLGGALPIAELLAIDLKTLVRMGLGIPGSSNR